MKSVKIGAIFGGLMLCVSSLFAQIGINTLVPDTSAALHIVAKPYGQGLLMPGLFQARRNAIFRPATGLITYDQSNRLFYYNRGTALTPQWFAVNPWLTQGDSITPNVLYTDATVTNVGIGTQSPSQKLEVAGNIKSTGMVAANTLTVNGFALNALVPTGGIIMWSGNPNSLPAGWALCDGTNGTPNLSGRFIVSYGQNSTPAVGDSNPNYGMLQTGGENSHTITVPELPRHKHSAFGDGASIQAAGGSHQHSTNPNGQGTGAQRAGGNSGGLANDSQGTVMTSWNTHSHPNSEFSGEVGDGTTQGMNSQPFDNRPPFYVLAFIIKLP